MTESIEAPLRILRIKGVQETTGLSRSHIYHLSAIKQFPQSIPLVPGGSARGWIEAEIQEWLAQRIQAREQEVLS